MATRLSTLCLAYAFVGVILQDQDAAQQVFLSSTNPMPCYNDIVDLHCYVLDVEQVNGQTKYLTSKPSWRKDEKPLYSKVNALPDVNGTNGTTWQLRVRIDPGNFTGDPVTYTCYLSLTGGGEDNDSTVVDPQETAAAPILIHHVVHSTYATLWWNHTEKGNCYNSLNLSYNVTWHSVVGGVLQMDAQTITTQSGAKEVAIQGLQPDTVYHVEIVGFSTDNPFPVTSQLLLVNLTTKDAVIQGGGPDLVVLLLLLLLLPVVVVVVVVLILCWKLQWWKRMVNWMCLRDRMKRKKDSSGQEDPKSLDLGDRREPASGSASVGSPEEGEPKPCNDRENCVTNKKEAKRMDVLCPVVVLQNADMNESLMEGHEVPTSPTLQEEGRTKPSQCV